MLTNEEENKLRQIIIAYDNGKKIDELPELGSANPLDLTIEVSDNGISKQSKMGALLPYVEDQVAYGIEWDITVPTTPATRIGNADLHRSLPVQSRMRGCLLNDDGTVREYLNPSTWEGHVLDGTRGQVMVEIPSHYRRFDVDGNKRRAKISEYPVPGYEFVTVKYISAYEAAMDRTTGTLCSVVNADANFRGGNNTDWDGTYRSLLGMPVTSTSRPLLRTAARNRGDGWACNDYNVYRDMVWLYFIEYANLNSQTAYNPERDGSGFMQGGLGIGVTNIAGTDWTTYNNQNPFIACGTTNTLGNMSGQTTVTLADEFPGTTRTVTPNRYRGVENPFGHIWKLTDGILIQVAADNTQVNVSDNPTAYGDSITADYEMRGLESRTTGFITDIILNSYGDIVPSAVGGSSSTYWSDYHITGTTPLGLRPIASGGSAAEGSMAGLMCVSSNVTINASGANIGSRLCFTPSN